ncbi:S41 family peptidase [Desulfoscipio gibsoniae]|uniref:C-terminal processing peptidase n=1 Tax=Desulfoscipio gibsoniae DSM 7213 TaxID=767817 RepID=R4KHI7_9FIRM|nr:S41 family peptidase [Desulfoscipio gibsoniae]AGL01112.1 C-terminal processing peptidase [Desulfoscipio gibsoniae DSM 7213]
MNRRLLILTCAILLVFSCFKPAQAARDLESGAALVVELMDLMHEYHLNNPDAAVLTGGAIQGLLDSLEDPYAEYFSAEELKGFTDTLNGDLQGIGIEMLAGEEYPNVFRVIPDTPAAKGGILAGDIIVAVDGQDIAGWTLADVVDKVRGPIDSKVVLTIQRGDDTLEFSLQRADIHVPSVNYEMLAGKTGYINLTSFGASTGREFEEALRNLKSTGMESLIIDLRYNGGGLLEEAVDILSNFVAGDTLAVVTVDGQGNRGEIRTWDKPGAASLPMVVLVNELSASASELLAGALQDYELAALVGNVTFGKGVVQTIIPLSSGGALKITVSKYLTPTGRDIDAVGLIPDHYVVAEELQREIAWQILHPEDTPDLTLEPGTGRAVLNGRALEMTINVEKEGSIYKLPLRPVLEAMLYQVYWNDGVIRVFSGQEEVWSIDPSRGGSNEQSDIFLKDGVSYLTENILKQLNIVISKEEDQITLTRLMH